MPVVFLYFQVHQPYRLRPYSFFDIGSVHEYEDEERNQAILDKIADKCYIPANGILLELIRRYNGDFRVAFSLTGVAIDQLARYRPDALESFRQLAGTGCVEFLDETFYHSLAFLFSLREFKEQVRLHRKRIGELFKRRPVAFRYTELIYNNELARLARDMGYRVVLAEGVDAVLGWRSPNYPYHPPGCPSMLVLLKNYRLSDDVAFRFSVRGWSEYPLTAEKYAHWIHQIQGEGAIINLFMDYETFGEHQWEDTGIFDFLRELPEAIFRHGEFRFRTPADIVGTHEPVGEVSVPDLTSWADAERDVSAWLGNAMQRDAIRAIYGLEEEVRRRGDADLLHTWRKLQTSDHFYYMCTKWFADGDVHKYFNPYESPYEAYINYMNVVNDFSRQLADRTGRKPRKGKGPSSSAKDTK